MPVTIPVEPTVATDGVPLLHVPPAVASFNVVVKPTHTLAVPVIASGVVFTVILYVVKQLVPKVYVIIAVPAVNPVTVPEELMLPMDGALLLHVPPPVVSDKVVVNPVHTVVLPVIGFGRGLTVTTEVVVQPEGSV